MDTFLCRLLIFMVPIGFGFILMEYSLRSIPNDYSYKNSYLKENAEDIEVLILGNSHFYRGIIAEDLSLNSFNAAYISQTLNLDLLIFDKFKERLINLEYLVVGVSYPTLFSSLENANESWRLKNYNLYYDLNITNDPVNYSEILSNSFKVNKSKLINYYSNHKNPITASTKGSGPLNEIRDIAKTGPVAALRHTNEKLPYYRAYIKNLDEVIEYCNRHNIKIILLTLPTYKSYKENLNFKQLSLMECLLDSTAGRNPNVYWLNYLESPTFNYKDFLDGDHLNRLGANKFTEILNRKIDSISSQN